MNGTLRFIFPLTLAAGLLTGCATTATSTQGETYWVNSLKVPCSGVGKQQCIQVQKNDSLDPTGWRTFYSPIEGFEYEEGYIYQLRVAEQPRTEPVPADRSSIAYQLIEQVDKQLDTKLGLHDIWSLTTINGADYVPMNPERPARLAIDIQTLQVRGFDGCNAFTGSIKSVGNTELEFAPLAGTKKFCPDMSVPQAMGKNFSQVTAYRIDGQQLYLMGAGQQTLMVFKKMD